MLLKKWQRESGFGTAKSVRVSESWLDEKTSAGINVSIIITVRLTQMFTFHPDIDPSLELKYRTKKLREKAVEPERVEKTFNTSDFKLERRRGSKVSICNFVLSIYCCCFFFMHV